MARQRIITINADQRRLIKTMLALIIIAICILYFFSWRLTRWPALPLREVEALPAFSSQEAMVERPVADLPANDHYDELSLLGSPDGSQFAYIAKEKTGRRIVSNGESGPLVDNITFLGFSPDGKNLAYTAKRAGKEVAVLNGQVGKEYDWIFNPRFFTADSQAFIYKARDSRGDMIVINGKESQAYERIYELQPTPDNDRLVFFARKDGQLWRGEIPLNE